ncbi:MAG: hypothetical protein MUC65_08450 [Pontiellaceae bacterium]|nr:hypothetical protein [Pontiellaceae bacterium]
MMNRPGSRLRLFYIHSPADLPNDPVRFGEQPVVGVNNELIGTAEKLLVNGTDISFFNLVPLALDAGALCIPSHIDRPM